MATRGRPALPEEEKRQQIGVRTSSALKRDLESAASRNGRSVAQEAEFRLERSLADERAAGSAATLRLLNMLAAEVAIIEGVTGKHWDRDLRTWAAVAEMFERGPIKRLVPEQDRRENDSVVIEARDRLFALQERQKEAERHLAAAGYAPPSVGSALWLGKSSGIYAETVKAALGPNAAVNQLRERITRDHPTDADAQPLLSIVAELEALTSKIADAWKRYDEAVQPFKDAEDQGREAYRTILRQRARQALLDGQFPHLEDLI